MNVKPSLSSSIIPAFFALLILGSFGYLIFTDSKTTAAPPSIEVMEPSGDLPLSIIKQQDKSLNSKQIIAKEAQQFVENLSPSNEQGKPIIVEEEQDKFVRHDSVISLADEGAIKQQIRIKEIIPVDEQTDNALYYIHRVTDRDHQGLWGIIQTGLIDKFRQGLPIKGISQNKEFISVVIPQYADEKLRSGLSSFLGKILTKKVDSSYIYNFQSKKMGRNANIIEPGQQLALISFQADELATIYQFFSKSRNQGIETFSVTD